jgi:hypothetical protein
MTRKLPRVTLQYAGAVNRLELQKVLSAQLCVPLHDSGVPVEKVHAAARSIAESFPLLGEGEYLRVNDVRKASRPYDAALPLVEEYDKRPGGYKIRAAKRLGCSPTSLRPVIKALRDAGQLGGALRRETRVLIKCAARRAGVRLNDAAIAGVAKRLALLSVLAAVDRAHAEIRRRDAVAEAQRGRPATIERYGLDAEIVDRLSKGQTQTQILFGMPGFTRDMLAKFAAKHRPKQ